MICFKILMVSHILATNYYVSNSGNDSNNGLTPATAWKTVNKVNSKICIFVAGDSILFKRGDTFSDNMISWNCVSGTVAQPIVISAYGAGANPIFSGSQIITGWTSCSTCTTPNMYVANYNPAAGSNFTTIPPHLFVDGKLQTIARYPNTGTLTVDAQTPDPVKGFIDNDLTQPVDYYKGANVRIRMEHFMWYVKTVASSSNGTINITPDFGPTWRPIPTWGYYFDNLYSFLDTPGEWYFDNNTKQIYLVMNSGDNPNSHVIEVPYINRGIAVYQQNNIVISNITFRMHNTRGGVSQSGFANNLQLINNTFDKEIVSGIEIDSCINCIISANIFKDNVNNAVNSNRLHNCLITKNNFARIGLVTSYGAAATSWADAGILIKNSQNCSITYNTMDSIGYCGILDDRGKGHWIEKNVLTNTMMSLDDGAAIYTWGGKNFIIKNNIIKDVKGNLVGIPKTKTKSMGIYLDETTSYCTVFNNTVSYISANGINFNLSKYNFCSFNILYNCGAYGVFFSDYGTVSAPGPNNVKGNFLSNNTVVQFADSQFVVGINTGFNNADSVGTFQNNYFWHITRFPCFRVSEVPGYPSSTSIWGAIYIYEDWMKRFNISSGGKTINNYKSWYFSNPYTVTSVTGSDLIAGSNFESSIAGWFASVPSSPKFTVTRVNDQPNLTNWSLKLYNTAGDNAIARTTQFTMTQNQMYRLKFDVVANKQSFTSITIKQNSVTWGYPLDYLGTKVSATTGKTSYEFIFPAKQTDVNTRIFLGSNIVDSLLWFDNMELVPVNVSSKNLQEEVKLFSNSTDVTANIYLGGKLYKDLDGNMIYQSSLTLQPFSSKVLVLVAGGKRNFYVSTSAGNDANDGLSPATAWKTISKLTSMMPNFGAGDSILFKRGDTFRGQLNIVASGASGNNIVFCAYCSGKNPVFNGSEPVTGWTTCGTCNPGVYEKSFTTCVPKHLYLNGKELIIARYPNTGYLTIDIVNANAATGFQDNDLTNADGYWNGATLKYRAARWCFGITNVSNYTNKTFTFTTNVQSDLYYPKIGWGYYLEGKLSELDADGEWFYDATSQKLYVKTTNPNSQNIEASVYENGIYIHNQNYLTIKNLNFKQQQTNGIGIHTYTNNWQLRSSYITIENDTFSSIGYNGVSISSLKDVSNVQVSNRIFIRNNHFEKLNNSGVDADTCFAVSVQNNTFKNISLTPGYNVSFSQEGGDAVFFGRTSSYCTTGNNVVDSIGYTGIQYLHSSTNLIEKNFVSNTNLILDDGAGIYAFGSTSNNTIIRNNFVKDAIGNISATNQTYTMAEGIYIDEGTNNFNVYENTIQNVDNGVKYNNSHHHNVHHNNIYNCRQAGVVFSDIEPSSTIIMNYSNNLTDNNIVCLKEECYPVYIFSNKMSSKQMLTQMDRNIYWNTYSNWTLYRKQRNNLGVYFWDVLKLSAIKDTFLNNTNSLTGFLPYFPPYTINSYGTNNITNSTFDSNIANWGVYSSPAGVLTITYDTNPAFTTGCMKVANNGVWGHYSAANMWLKKDTLYLLEFSVIGTNYQTLDLYVKKDCVWGGLNWLHTNHQAVTPKRTDYKYVFKPTAADACGKFFSLSPGTALPYYIDEVKIRAFTGSYDDPLERTKLFENKTNTVQNISLNGKTYKDLSGNFINATQITLQPLTSKILVLCDEQLWLGTTDKNWSNGTNWSSGTIPTFSSNATVVSTATNQPEITAASYCKNLNIGTQSQLTIQPNKSVTVTGLLNNYSGNNGLFIKSDATGSGSLIHNTDDVSATVQLYLSSGKYHYVSSPVEISNANIFNDINQKYFYNEKTFDSWDASGNMIGTSGWVQANSQPLTATTGLAVKMIDSKIYSFNGLLNNGIYTINLTNTPSGYAAKYDGWNLIGNPYPSALDWDLITKSGVANSIYYYNGTNYSYYVAEGINEGTGIGANMDAGTSGRYIPVGQGFMVKCLNPKGYVNFTNKARTHTTQSFYKSENADVIRLNVLQNSNGAKDETVIRFLDKASEVFDGDYDAYKMFGSNANIPNLYSLTNGGDELAISTFQKFETFGKFEVQLGLSAQAGTYTISASNITLLNPTSVYIEDKILNNFTDLRLNTYTFSHIGGDVRDRFRIVFNSHLQSLELLESSQINIWSFEKTIFISNFAQNSNLEVCDVLGRKVFAQTLQGFGNLVRFQTVETNLPEGIYIIKFKGVSKKIIIQ